MTLHPAMLFQALDQGQVECQLCAHTCRLLPGQTGRCRVRHNRAGQLVTSSYGQPVAMAVEPIEKKCLFHVLPGSKTLSLGTWGCNLSCRYCINWRVSQRGADLAQTAVSPEEVIAQALANQVRVIAFTYTEPTIFFEYALDIATLARRAGLAVVAKSNGYMTPPAMEALAPVLDAVNIDLKGWRTDDLRRLTGAEVAPVLENLRLARRLGLWVEVSTPIVPGFTDSLEELENIAGFIAGDLGGDTPWHVLRCFPHYRLAGSHVTPQESLRQAVTVGRRIGLRYVYCKDLIREHGLDTHCPGCGEIAIQRGHSEPVENRLQNRRCARCRQVLAGIMLDPRSFDVNARGIAHECKTCRSIR